MLYLSDKLSILFVFLVLFWILIVTTGFVSPVSGLFGIVNRGYGRDTTRYNDINIYKKTRIKGSNNNRASKSLNRAFFIYTIFTVLVFLLTVIASKMGI